MRPFCDRSSGQESRGTSSGEQGLPRHQASGTRRSAIDDLVPLGPLPAQHLLKLGVVLLHPDTQGRVQRRPGYFLREAMYELRAGLAVAPDHVAAADGSVVMSRGALIEAMTRHREGLPIQAAAPRLTVAPVPTQLVCPGSPKYGLNRGETRAVLVAGKARIAC